MFELALQLADSTTDDILQRRSELLLAVSYIYQERPYEAVAIADYFLRNHGDSAPEMLKFAGDVVLSAMTTAYERADDGDRDFERRYLLGITTLLSTRWPDTELANRANISAGKLLRANKEHLAAAEEFLKVSATSPDRGSAELMAGSAYLSHFEQQAMLEGAEAATPEDLLGWRDSAEQYLQSGVAAVAAQTPAEAINEDLLRGKVALAIVRNVKGVYTTQGDVAGAVELLTTDPHSVLKATEPPAGQARPTAGSSLQSSEFAGVVYRILLRAYIGAKNIDAARATMKTLETLGGPGNSADLTQTFVEFGKQLQQELTQLESAGETERLGEVRQGFETFLTDLYNRDESQQTFGSLNWIAETYVSLAEGSRDDLAKSTEYFEKAANAYAKIISRGSADAAFYGSPQNEIAVKVRMLEARLAQQDYEAAEQTLAEVLKTAANAPNVQLTAARLYQQWGESGDSSKYQVAMHGGKEKGEVWGWGGLANRMHEQILRDPNRDDFRAIFFEAVHEHARTMQLAAKNMTGDERTKLLRRAVQNLETVGRTTRNIPDEEYKKLNTLYRALLADVGLEVADLRRGGAAVARTDDTTNTGTGGGTLVPPQPVEEEVKSNPHQTRNMIVALVLFVVGGAAVYGIFRWTNAQANRRRAAKLAAIASTPAKPKRAKANQP
jgi:tetratricopeptide (TPR) repeat protein